MAITFFSFQGILLPVGHQILPTTCGRIEVDCPSVFVSLRRNDHLTGPSAISTGLGGTRLLSSSRSTGLVSGGLACKETLCGRLWMWLVLLAAVLPPSCALRS